jgi:hypothetical protein
MLYLARVILTDLLTYLLERLTHTTFQRRSSLTSAPTRARATTSLPACQPRWPSCRRGSQSTTPPPCRRATGCGPTQPLARGCTTVRGCHGEPAWWATAAHNDKSNANAPWVRIVNLCVLSKRLCESKVFFIYRAQPAAASRHCGHTDPTVPHPHFSDAVGVVFRCWVPTSRCRARLTLRSPPTRTRRALFERHAAADGLRRIISSLAGCLRPPGANSILHSARMILSDVLTCTVPPCVSSLPY